MIEDRIEQNNKLVVLLKIHPKADYGKMVACLDELRLAKATKVSLKTAEE
jgi:biopolymer transport protein ExbD